MGVIPDKRIRGEKYSDIEIDMLFRQFAGMAARITALEERQNLFFQLEEELRRMMKVICLHVLGQEKPPETATVWPPQPKQPEVKVPDEDEEEGIVV